MKIKQFTAALRLAFAHGHAWAYQLAGEDWEGPGNAAYPVGEEYQIHRLAWVGPIPKVEEIDAFSSAQPDTWGSAITSPEVVHGSVVHTSGTHRISWQVWASGRVQIAISRPAPVGTVLRIVLSPAPGDQMKWKVEVVETPSTAFHARHVKAAQEALAALVGPEAAAASLSGVSQRALPDEAKED